MLVTIDIGNTHSCIGLFDRDKLVKEFRVATNRHATSDEWRLILDGLLREMKHQVKWEGIVLASVVPELDTVMEQAARNTLKVPVLTVTPDLELPIKNGYEPVQSVGADRLMSAVAAVAEFGAPVVIVDFGTATTIDMVSPDKLYLGGSIMPGLSLSAEALAQGTSLLHRIDLKSPANCYGRNTEESIRSGIIFGAAGAVNYIVIKMKKQLGQSVKVVATGGLAYLIKPYCPVIKTIRPALTLHGMRLTWHHHEKSN